MTMRLLLLPLLAACAWSADPVGMWRYGVGLVDGKLAKVGTVVLTGQSVVADDAAPLRMVCTDAPGITTILAAGSSGSFAVEIAADGSRVLVMNLQRGAVQMDITDKAPFSAVRVRGAALDVRVTGTLFVVERTRRDADFVALVRGKVHVGLKPEVAKALGKAGEIELLEHQGVAGDTTGGLGTPTALSARPQIGFSASMRSSIADQGAGLDDQGTGWDQDLADQMTSGDMDDLAGGSTPFGEMAEDLVDSLSELGSAPQSVGDQVTEGSSPPGNPALALPPPPPPGP
jgi:hypothetical protein